MFGWRLLEIQLGTSVYLKALKKVSGPFVAEFRSAFEHVWWHITGIAQRWCCCIDSVWCDNLSESFAWIHL